VCDVERSDADMVCDVVKRERDIDVLVVVWCEENEDGRTLDALTTQSIHIERKSSLNN